MAERLHWAGFSASKWKTLEFRYVGTLKIQCLSVGSDWGRAKGKAPTMPGRYLLYVLGGNLGVAFISSRLSAFAQFLHLGLGFRHCDVRQFKRGLGENLNVRVRLNPHAGFGCQRHTP